jgi:hypothetical protein
MEALASRLVRLLYDDLVEPAASRSSVLFRMYVTAEFGSLDTPLRAFARRNDWWADAARRDALPHATPVKQSSLFDRMQSLFGTRMQCPRGRRRAGDRDRPERVPPS